MEPQGWRACIAPTHSALDGGEWSASCPRECMYGFRIIIIETAIISLKSINQLVFVTEKYCVFFVVRTGFLNTIDMLPSQGLMSELGVLIQCSGTPLNFSPCSTFHLYLLHTRMSHFLSNPPLPEDQAGTAWGP
jgi:hypothetical protein